MPTINSKTYCARVRKGDIETLEEQMNGRSFSEWVREKLRENEIDEDNREIARLCGVTYKDLLEMLNYGLNEGKLEIIEGELRDTRNL